jgi:UDP:flavonoid glycosyltransferase YjiC (YdhE family)
VPHLVLPQAADQFSNAQMVLDAKAGQRLLSSDVTASSVREHAAALLDDEGVKGHAAALAGEIAAMPSPEDIIARLTGGDEGPSTGPIKTSQRRKAARRRS